MKIWKENCQPWALKSVGWNKGKKKSQSWRGLDWDSKYFRIKDGSFVSASRRGSTKPEQFERSSLAPEFLNFRKTVRRLAGFGGFSAGDSGHSENEKNVSPDENVPNHASFLQAVLLFLATPVPQIETLKVTYFAQESLADPLWRCQNGS